MNPQGAAARARPARETRSPLVALVGNPNTGKTTLFNRLTGQNARVGNYPGVTVERRTGRAKLCDTQGVRTVELLDVPGAYSLSARSAEEQVAIDALLGWNENPRPDLAVVVLDATQLVRNLYLALQIVELCIPVVLALNMMDEAGPHPPDARAISELFGVPCVPVAARMGVGVPKLKRAIAAALREPPGSSIALHYPTELLADADRVAEALPDEWRGRAPPRALALWALSSIDIDDELVRVDPGLRRRVLEVQQVAERAGRDLDREIIATRYAWLDDHLADLHRPPPPRTWAERVDRVLLHPVWGFAIFLLVMFTMFQALFSWSDPAISLIETGFDDLAGWLSAVLPSGWYTDLLVQGIIGGVGNVVVFLPQIMLLFLFIGIMEDSGYMARAAYLMDRIMRSLGLHGRAFVPMLSGYACAVPAIMATRTMERERDRLLTMMVVPLMTCSARLPIYTLLIGALFPPTHVLGILPLQGLMMVGIYLFSTLVALTAAGILGKTVLKGPRVPLILELPPYRLPTIRDTARLVWQRARTFLTEAGTIILACTVVIWGLLSYPKPHDTAPAPAADLPAAGVVSPTSTTSASAHEAAVAKTNTVRSRAIAQSFGGRIGRFIEPVIKPLGFDWKIGIGLIGAFTAREVFISTMGIVYGVGDDVDEQSLSLRERINAETRVDGHPLYTPLTGLSLMIFFALAMQCMSTMAIVRRESKSWRWPAFLFGYMTTLAWVACFVVYQGGRLLGFG